MSSESSESGSDQRDYSEYGFESSIVEHEGFSVGDQILVNEDGHDGNYYNGEEGQVIGFIKIPAAENPELARAFGRDAHGRIAIYVLMDGTEEPIEVKPEHMDVE